MADNLNFPILFDLEKGVNEAGQLWDKKYAKKLEDYMAKRPVHIKLDFEKLEDVKRRLAQLKIEPVTPETKAAIKELARELQVLAKALEQVQKYSISRATASTDAVRASKIAVNHERAKAQAALAAQRAAKAEDNLAAARLKAARAAGVGTSATRSANQAYQEQAGYLQRLTQRMAAYWSIRQVGNFLTSVREVTAQFELQRISLGAIIQDQGRANQLFQEIKTFALKSPVKILDLTKYTKQLAAYKIGVDELFETTKRLTDISVGLGVSMDRVVLAYGQVRARGALYASEIRQFTEMGVPIVEELAAKLYKMNGELVTSKDVLEMVSKGAISFEMVKEVFEDMTSAGGIFYNMQEKQGNTLYGMWQKLGDAAAVMYDEIGNTEWVNEGMKDAIQMLRTIMLNWKQTAVVVGGLTATIALNTIAQANLRVATNASSSANIKNITTLNARQIALQRELASLKGVAISERTRIAGLISATQAEISAATATNVFSRSLYKLKAALMSNPIGLLAVALSTVIGYLMTAQSEVAKLTARVGDISSQYAAKAKESKERFEELVAIAKSSADGSKRQKEALDELNRTYGEILGSEALEINNLRAMTNGYQELTDKIDRYHKKRKDEEVLTATKASWTQRIEDAKAPLKSYLEGLGATEEEIEKALLEIRERIEIGGEEARKVTQEVLGRYYNAVWKNSKRQIAQGPGAFTDMLWGSVKTGWNWLENADYKYLERYGQSIQNMSRSLDGLEDRIAANATGLGIYAKRIDLATRAIANFDYTSKQAFDESVANYNKLHPDRALKDIEMSQWLEKNDPSKAVQQLEKDMLENNARIMSLWKNLVPILQQEGVGNYTQFFEQSTNGKERSVIHWKEILNVEGLSGDAKNAIKALQSITENIAPSDRTVDTMTTRLKQIADKSGIELKKMTAHYMKAGESLDDYRKRLDETIQSLDKSVTHMHTVNTQRAAGEMLAHNGYTDEEIKSTQQMADALRIMLGLIPDTSQATGRGDGRVETLEKINRALREMYEQYGKLEKRVGTSRATEQAEKVYKQELDYLRELAKDNGLELNLNMPKTIKELNEMQTQIWNALNRINTKVARRAMIDQGKVMGSDWMEANTKQIDDKLKALADRISRTKTAKEFYQKILSQTGDLELAANVTFSIYGENGKDLKKQLAGQVRAMTNGLKLPHNIISAENIIDYKALREWANANEKELGGMYAKLIKISDDGEKELVKVAEQGAKLLLSYDEIAQKRVNIEQEASDKIRQLREAEALYLASKATEASKTDFSNRTNNAIQAIEADRDLKLLKLKDQYLRFFSAIHTLTSKEAEKLRTEVRQALFKAFQSGAISADELKRELKAVDEQFQKLINDSGITMTYLKDGFDGLIKRVRDTADELQAVASEISKMKSANQITEGQKNFINSVLGKFGDNTTGKNFSELFSKTNGDLKQMGGLLSNVSGKMGGMASSASGTLAIIDMIIKNVAAAINGIAQIRDQLNEMRSEDNQLEGGMWDAFEYLENFNKYAASGWEKLKSGNLFGAIADVGSSIISIFGTSLNQRVKRANKEIKRQQDIIEDLEYAYGRLEKAADKVFGTDYIANQKQQQQILLAQQQAHLKQVEAERSKGKKADKDRIKEYENQARDTADAIADMQGKIAQQMTGTDVASAARDFANAWLQAYATFGNTTTAIKEKFNDMIKNMIVESIMARTVQMALQPMFDQMDQMYKSGASMTDVLSYAFSQAGTLTQQITDGLTINAKQLESMGINIRDLYDTSDNMKGIAKDISGATSQEILQLAGFVNTALYYISPIPRIDQNIIAIRQLIEHGNPTTAIPATPGWTDWQHQAMENYNAIARNTAETVVECRRAADACTAATEKLNRAFQAKGTTSGFNVFLNS